MKWGVETIISEAFHTVELNLKQINENGPIKEWHDQNYDMTFFSTHDEALSNLNQVRTAWRKNGSYQIIG